MCTKFTDVNIHVHVLDDVELDAGHMWDIIILMEMYITYLRDTTPRLLT